MYRIRINGSLKLGTVLMIVAVIASAMAALFVLHAETDNSSAEVVESGWCGPDATYYIFSDGNLLISGTGAMYDYNCFTHAPWYEYRESINRIIISNGITQLGASAFIGMKYVTELTIPITVNSVVSDVNPAFAGCYRIAKICFLMGKDGNGFDYTAYEGSNAWYQNTPWYESRENLKEIEFSYGTTHIGSDAFRDLNITSLEIPDTVTSLGCHSFYNCAKLTELTIPVSLNSYGNENYPAFEGCMAVNKVIFTNGNGVPFDYSDWTLSELNARLAPWNLNSAVTKTIVISDTVTELGNHMFYGCNIKELTVPLNALYRCCPFKTPYDSLEKVTITKGNGASCDFDNNASEILPWNSAANLKSIFVEDGVTFIGDFMFYHCTADTVVLPDTIGSFGRYAFSYSAVRDLTLPISANTIYRDEHSAFSGTTGIEKITFTPGSGVGFNYTAYEGSNCWYQLTPWYQCRDTLKEIVFKDGIKSIGSDAFRELNIVSLKIPDTVVALGCHSFYQCSKLTDLVIPITLDSICSEKYPAFDRCYAVEALRFTVGTDGIGVDYTNLAPFWCTPSHKLCLISIDSGITYIGTKTFAGYTFLGPDGEPLEHTAESLSGHVFAKTDDGSYAVYRTSDGNSEAYACGCIDLDPAVRFGSIAKTCSADGRY